MALKLQWTRQIRFRLSCFSPDGWELMRWVMVEPQLLFGLVKRSARGMEPEPGQQEKKQLQNSMADKRIRSTDQILKKNK
jgi:hypothetical protein